MYVGGGGGLCVCVASVLHASRNVLPLSPLGTELGLECVCICRQCVRVCVWHVCQQMFSIIYDNWGQGRGQGVGGGGGGGC